ncbi:MAG: competence/damage-inducible protein A [Bacteroidia bacterium]|nr:competence/damage-inducible protein A [Bacteroidia bacterium]
MTAEIITIGDEILIGQIIDSNSAWMAQQLNFIGIKVKQITSVSDSETHIIEALNAAIQRADIILMTGGLGPTNDDLTKPTLCKYFNTGLRFDETAYRDIEALFKQRGREVTPLNRMQAEVPENCKTIYNKNGTAPGMWFEEKGKIFISLPGVPFEMKSMMTESVLPWLAGKFNLPPVIHRTILTQGIGESILADKIKEWENALPADLQLAYLPSVGMVRLRLSAVGEKKKTSAEINSQIEKVLPLIDKYVFGFDDDTLQSRVGVELKKRNATLVATESCTGGYVAHLITSVPGSSAYFKGGIVSYSNEMKVDVLHVSADTLKKHGAVSEETVMEMAENAKRIFKTDYAVATSGIAGPDGGTQEKPVGTVWIAAATPDKIINRKLQLGNKRLHIIEVASQSVLHLLLKDLV